MEDKKVLLAQLEAIIRLHEKMRGSYFYSPPRNASSRRNYEEYNSLETTFEYNGDTIRVSQDTRCSCRNVYYSVNYYINDEPVRKDIRFIKKILKEIGEAES